MAVKLEEKIMKKRLQHMEEEAVNEMLHYHEKNGKQKIKDFIKRAAGRYVEPKDMIFWHTALIVNSLTEWGVEDRFLPDVKTYFDRWIGAGMPVYVVDDVLAGASLIDLYEKTGEEKYKQGADKLAEYLFALEKEEGDEKGGIPYRPSQKNGHIYADGIGMICSFLIKYGVKFESIHEVELGLQQMRNMMAFGMDAKTGLPYHGFRYADGIKHGIIGWGRAVGWLFIGMGRSLACLGSMKKKREESKAGELKEGQEFCECCRRAYEELERAFWQLFRAIEPYQKKNGSFGWQLEALEGPEDSSATAMIAYGTVLVLRGQQGMGKAESAKEGQNQIEEVETAGKCPDQMREAARKLAERAAEYLVSCERGGKIYNCSAECMGFSEYPQQYSAYPWSLGPGLGVLRWYGEEICE